MPLRANRPIMSSARIVAKVEDFLAKFPPLATPDLHGLTLEAWLEAAEAWRIGRALEEARGNRTEAARALGIARRTLYKRMEKLGIDPSHDGGEAPRASRRVAAPVRPIRAGAQLGQRRRVERGAQASELAKIHL